MSGFLLWHYPSIDYLFRCKRVILSLTPKEWGITPRLIISFVSNGSYCRSRLKNEVCVFGLFVVAVSVDWLFLSLQTGHIVAHAAFAIVAHVFGPNRLLSLMLKERGMHIWLVYCGSIPSIDYFVRSKRVILSLTLEERGIHIWLVCCRSHSRSKRVTLSLTLKERGIHACLVCLLWQMQFPIVYGPKTALTIRTNRTDRQTAVSPSLEWHVICATNEVQFSDCIRTETVFYDLPNGTDRKLVVSNRISLCVLDMTGLSTDKHYSLPPEAFYLQNQRLLWAAHGWMYPCVSVSKRVFVWNVPYKKRSVMRTCV